MNIRTFYTDRFIVSVDAEPDYDIDLSFDETGEVREKLNSGEYQGFYVKASVTYKGREIASDYLGGCIYTHPREFMDHRGIKPKGRADGRNYGSYFSDMVREVCREARKTLSDLKTAKVRTV